MVLGSMVAPEKARKRLSLDWQVAALTYRFVRVLADGMRGSLMAA